MFQGRREGRGVRQRARAPFTSWCAAVLEQEALHAQRPLAALGDEGGHGLGEGSGRAG